MKAIIISDSESLKTIKCMKKHTDQEGNYSDFKINSDGFVICGKCGRLLNPTMEYDLNSGKVSYWNGSRWIKYKNIENREVE